MKLYIILISIIFFAIGCNQQANNRKTWDDLRYARLRVLKDVVFSERPIILISSDHFGEVNPKVLVTIWQNGRIVWSKDQVNGGRPYYQGNVSSNAVKTFLSDLEKEDYFSDIYLNYPELGCDVRSTIISICSNRRVLCMESAHELYPNLQEQRTKRYLKKWKYVRDKINSLIPHEGKVVNFNYNIGFARLFEPDRVSSYFPGE